MISYQYTYLIGDLIILALWGILFFRRKDTRKEMLTISLIFGITGVLIENIHILDWWKPLTITGTPIGIEDFLCGFGVGGISSVIYEHLFHKRIKIKKVKKIKEENRRIKLAFIISLLAVIVWTSFFILELNSFKSITLGLVITTALIWIKRKDLIKNSLISGFLVLMLSVIGYGLLNNITPGFFDQFWLYQNIGRIIVLGIPLEEHVFYFLAGAFIGPLYEYWKEGKLINVKR